MADKNKKINELENHNIRLSLIQDQARNIINQVRHSASDRKRLNFNSVNNEKCYQFNPKKTYETYSLPLPPASSPPIVRPVTIWSRSSRSTSKSWRDQWRPRLESMASKEPRNSATMLSKSRSLPQILQRCY